MKTRTFRRFGGNTLLAIATAAAAVLVGLTVSASTGASSDDPTVDHCISTADAATGWLENGGTLPSCAGESPDRDGHPTTRLR